MELVVGGKSSSFRRTPSALLGYGGFGRVFKYKNQLDDVTYAIKEIPVEDDMDRAISVLNEIRILARLSHPNIVRYHHAWVEEDKSAETRYRCCIQMELCDSSLRGYIDSRESVNVVESKDFFCQLLDGVSYLHAHDISHNDLKPDNVMIRDVDGRKTVRIGDFGLALCSSGEGALEQGGTELYFPLSVPASRFEVDIYSLGVVLFELYCHFYTGMERIVTIRQLKRTLIPPPFFEKDYPLEAMMIRTMLHPTNKPSVDNLRSVYCVADHPYILCRDIVWGIICRALDHLLE